jgi:hypothetical protein
MLNSVLAPFIKDSETRIVIPTRMAILTQAITKLAKDLSSDTLTLPSAWQTYVANIGQLLLATANMFFFTLGVTAIEIEGKRSIAKTKGIGSIGEIIHLTGSYNEILNVEFETSQYPGALGYAFLEILRVVLEQNDIIYIVDDFLSVAPCLVNKYSLRKIGSLKGTIIGQMELEILTVKRGIIPPVNLYGVSITTTAFSNLLTSLPTSMKWMAELGRQIANRR